MSKSGGWYKIDSSIWRERTMRSVSRSAQGTYFMIGSQADRTAVGTVPVSLAYWASLAARCTPEDVDADLVELNDAGLVKYDRQAQEVFIVGFVTEAGSWKSTSITAIERAARGMRSDILRTWLLAELRAIPWNQVNPTEITKGPNQGRLLSEVVYEMAEDIMDYLAEATAYLLPDRKDQAPPQAPTEAPPQAPSGGESMRRTSTHDSKLNPQISDSELNNSHTQELTVGSVPTDVGRVHSDELSTGHAAAGQVDQTTGEVLEVDGWGKRQQRDDDHQFVDKVTSVRTDDVQDLIEVDSGTADSKQTPAVAQQPARQIRYRLKDAKTRKTFDGIVSDQWPTIINTPDLRDLIRELAKTFDKQTGKKLVDAA